MRETLFRMYDGVKMVYDGLVIYDGELYEDYRAFEDGYESDNPLMQYTGLKDKNGVKVFEGDVLIIDDDKFVISWNDERCGFRMDYWMLDEQYDLSEFWPTSEIIGNIYENPELVDVTE